MLTLLIAWADFKPARDRCIQTPTMRVALQDREVTDSESLASVLIEIAEIASETFELQDVFHRVAAAVRRVIPFDNMGVVRIIEGDWAVMLTHQLPALPPVEAFWAELPAVFAWIEEGRQPVVAAAYPLSPGDVVIPPAAGALSIRGMASTAPIEVIRFAASNRLCVELDYMDEQGRRSTRVIEPYSLRQTQAGEIVLHAVRADSQQHRSYRVDRIRGAATTQRTFIPRYAVELTPTGPISIPSAPVPVRTATPRASGWGRTSSRSWPVHVYECPLCNKHFQHSRRDSSLRSHKDKQGWPCYGRHGIWVDTKW